MCFVHVCDGSLLRSRSSEWPRHTFCACLRWKAHEASVADMEKRKGKRRDDRFCPGVPLGHVETAAPTSLRLKAQRCPDLRGYVGNLGPPCFHNPDGVVADGPRGPSVGRKAANAGLRSSAPSAQARTFPANVGCRRHVREERDERFQSWVWMYKRSNAGMSAAADTLAREDPRSLGSWVGRTGEGSAGIPAAPGIKSKLKALVCGSNEAVLPGKQPMQSRERHPESRGRLD